jgi:hypothetical protein
MSSVRGPLGFWSFPLLNRLLQLLGGGGGLRPAARNIEQIMWTDWRGRPREILIHRTIEA